jgi:glycosyltransferase involved in cell wall biosynthesis
LRSYATTRLVGLSEIAKKTEPTVLHVECEPWQYAAFQSVLLARRRGIPVGIHFAENGPRLVGVGGALRRFVARLLLKRCRYAIGWSTESAEIARRLAPRIRVKAYPGTGVTVSAGALPPVRYSQRWFGDDPGGHAKLAFVGRFSAEKGLEDFLHIADRLAQRVAIRVAIAGGPSSHPVLKGWVAARPWAHAHGVIGRPEVAELLAAADVLVCPSRTTAYAKEQFGKVPVEAMALGTPVFGFDCGALREVIGSGGVVREEGANDALVEELEHYFAMGAEDRVTLSDQARLQSSHFTNAALADGLVRLWSEILAEDAEKAGTSRSTLGCK